MVLDAAFASFLLRRGGVPKSESLSPHEGVTEAEVLLPNDGLVSALDVGAETHWDDSCFGAEAVEVVGALG